MFGCNNEYFYKFLSSWFCLTSFYLIYKKPKKIFLKSILEVNKMKSLIIILFIIISVNSFAQLQDSPTRLMTSTEIEDMVKLALSDANVLAKKQELENAGYQYVPSNTIGGIRDDGAAVINLGFNKGDVTLTTHIMYAKNGSQVYVTFFEANIDGSTGQLGNLEAYELVNGGQRGANKFAPTENVLGCWAGGCAGALLACLASNCGYWACWGLVCAGSGLGCWVSSWF